MRIFFMLVTLGFLFGSQVSVAAQITMPQCIDRVAEINKTLPMDLDNITTWMSTTCASNDDGSLSLIYANSVADGNTVTQEQLDGLLPSLITSWCFGPSLSPLLALVDSVKYQYHFANNTPIGELNFSNEDCLTVPFE